ncbi:hypothetical protein CPAR01_13008, partial [Colletotrichum paranaense]
VFVKVGGEREKEKELANPILSGSSFFLLWFFSLSPCASIHPSIPYLSLPYGVLDWSRCALYLNDLGFFFSFSFSLTLSFPSLLYPLPTLSLPPSPLLSSSSSAHPIHPSFSPPNPHKI